MKKVMEFKESSGVPVALIHWPENKCMPYVVAWNAPQSEMTLDPQEQCIEYTGSWGQGHYFTNEIDARRCFQCEY